MRLVEFQRPIVRVGRLRRDRRGARSTGALGHRLSASPRFDVMFHRRSVCRSHCGLQRPQTGTQQPNPAIRETTMRVVEKVKQVVGARRSKGESRRSNDSDGKRSPSNDESLPGGASGREAAEATPQRAAELAD
jgi:hypothetical protein